MHHYVVILFLLVLAGLLLARPNRLGLGHGFHGSTLLGFGLLSAGMTWPLVLRAEWMMLDAGAGPDAFIGAWNLWWTREALLSGRNPFFTDLLFAPGGTSLALHTHAVTYGVLTLPFQLVFGSAPPGLYGVYNLTVLLSFTLTGYFTYRFALEVSRQRGASLLAAIAFSFSVYRFANTVRLHALATEWFVLAAWAGWRWMERPSVPRLVLAAGAAFLLAHASLEYLAYAVLFWLCLAVGKLIERRQGIGRGRPRSESVRSVTSDGSNKHRFAGASSGTGSGSNSSRFSPLHRIVISTTAAIVLAVLSIPLATQLLRRLRQGGTDFDPALAEHFSADLLDFLLPNPRHPIWGGVAERITGGFHHGDSGFGVSIGIAVLALFIFSASECVRARRERRWLYIALLFLVLTLGPRLHVAGNVLGAVPLPQAWLSQIVPFLAGSRTPIRYIVPAGLALAITIAIGWGIFRQRKSPVPGEHESSRLTGAQMSRLEIAVGAGLLFTLLAAPLTFTPEKVARVYQEVRDQSSPGAGTLLHVPGMPARESLLAQTVHRQRLIEDVSTAIPLHGGSEEAFRNRTWDIFAVGFAEPGAMEKMDEARRASVIGALREYLRRYDIKWIVVPASAAYQAVGTAGRVPPSALGPSAYAAYRENLRWLEPVEEREFGPFTLFAF